MNVSPETPCDPDSSADTPVISKAQSIELERRRIEGLSDPTLMVDWSIVQVELREQRGK